MRQHVEACFAALECRLIQLLAAAQSLLEGAPHIWRFSAVP